MVELCISKNSMFFFDFNGFWRENDVTRLTAKFKFQVMAKQINNFERAQRDKNKCEKGFGKAQLVKELLNFDFVISRHFVTIFRNRSTFQDATIRLRNRIHHRENKTENETLCRKRKQNGTPENYCH